jgi:hypothetical protein
MSFKVACLVLLACVAVIHAQADAPKKEDNEGRIFLSTFTVILSTVTSTTTIGSTTTCTTSTAALNTWFEIIHYVLINILLQRFPIDTQLSWSSPSWTLL